MFNRSKKWSYKEEFLQHNKRIKPKWRPRVMRERIEAKPRKIWYEGYRKAFFVIKIIGEL